MAVFRVEKSRDYSVMANFHFRDRNLSWKAKGILSNMLSLPDDWDYSLAGLEKLAKDGETSTRSAIKELELAGYLERKPVREKGKIVDWEYIIFEKPKEEKSVVEEPVVENPQVENQGQYNTNQLTTKELSIDLIKDIVDYLNQKAGTSYKYKSSKTQTLIKARLNEDFTIDDFKVVIDKKVSEWKGSDMEKYLRPETLFGTKFEGYLNQAEVKTMKPQQSSPNLDFDRKFGTVII